MKTLRFIGMALFAVLMCVNFTSCSSSNDDPTEGPEEGGGVSGKKIAKIIGTDNTESEIYTFSYDSKERLTEATYVQEYDNGKNTYKYIYQFIWGDDAIKVIEKYDSGNSGNTTLTLKNGLVQHEDYNDEGVGTFTYNSSNRLIKFSDGEDWINTAIWDGDKLVSISEYEEECTLTYGKSCKKGYFPFVASMIGLGESEILYMAHPEIAGVRTTQLPTSITWIYDGYGGTKSETSTMEYEFDKEGYISKIVGKKTDSDGSTDTFTYTLTWQ